MSIKAITEHWTWRIVGVPLGAVFVLVCSGLLDLIDGRSFGSTIRNNLADPDPFYTVFAIVGILIWFALIIAAYRGRNTKNHP